MEALSVHLSQSPFLSYKMKLKKVNFGAKVRLLLVISAFHTGVLI